MSPPVCCKWYRVFVGPATCWRKMSLGHGCGRVVRIAILPSQICAVHIYFFSIHDYIFALNQMTWWNQFSLDKVLNHTGVCVEDWLCCFVESTFVFWGVLCTFWIFFFFFFFFCSYWCGGRFCLVSYCTTIIYWLNLLMDCLISPHVPCKGVQVAMVMPAVVCCLRPLSSAITTLAAWLPLTTALCCKKQFISNRWWNEWWVVCTKQVGLPPGDVGTKDRQQW